MSLNAMSMTVKCDNSLCAKVHHEESPCYLTLTSRIEVFGEWPEKHFCDEICLQLYMQVKAPISGRDMNEPDLETLTKVVAARVGAESPWAKTHIHDILVTTWSILRTRVQWDVENAKAEGYKLGYKVREELLRIEEAAPGDGDGFDDVEVN